MTRHRPWILDSLTLLSRASAYKNIELLVLRQQVPVVLLTAAPARHLGEAVDQDADDPAAVFGPPPRHGLAQLGDGVQETGRVRRDHNDLSRAGLFRHLTDQRRLDVVEHLVALAAEADLPMTHLAMAFTIAHPRRTCALLGARTEAHLDDLLAGLNATVSDDVLDRIDEISPARYRRRCSRPGLPAAGPRELGLLRVAGPHRTRRVLSRISTRSWVTASIGFVA